MSEVPTLADVIAAMDRLYPPVLAEDWDAVGLTCGDPEAPVSRVLFAVDPVAGTVDEAISIGADLLITHHPLLLRPVSSVAADTTKGRLVHRLIREECALFTAHTNADRAENGVNDALARAVGLIDLSPLVPSDEGMSRTGLGRIGRLETPVTLGEFARAVSAALPSTPVGLKVAGDPDRLIEKVAVVGGAGDGNLTDATRAGVDAFITADLRHHPASEHLSGGGPALLDPGHWASEWPWLPVAAAALTDAFEGGLAARVSRICTDPWALHLP